MGVRSRKINGDLVNLTRRENQWEGRTQSAKARQGSSASKARHIQVQNHHIGLEIGCKFGQGFFTAGGDSNAVAKQFQDRLH